MEETTVAAIVVKGLGTDENGLQQYLWATKTQVERLLELQFDEQKNHYVYMLGDNSIRPCDILSVKFVKVKTALDWPAFRGYVLKELEAEEAKNQKLEINENGRLKLEELKKQHNLLRGEK